MMPDKGTAPGGGTPEALSKPFDVGNLPALIESAPAQVTGEAMRHNLRHVIEALARVPEAERSPFIASLCERVTVLDPLGPAKKLTARSVMKMLEATPTAEDQRRDAAALLVTMAPTWEGWARVDLTDPGLKPGDVDQGEGKSRDFVCEAPGGVWLVKTDGEGKRTTSPVCHTPLWVLSLTRDMGGGNVGRRLRWLDADGLQQEWVMPARLLSADGNAVREYLMDHGVRPVLTGAGKQLLTEYLMQEPEARERCTDRLGWHGDSFVLPDTCYGPADAEPVIFQAGLGIVPPIRTAGTLEGWQSGIATPAVGNYLLTFALSLALVPPLLALLNEDGRGFHFRGGTSSGKTTLLRVAGSVWGGGGRMGYRHSWNQTINHMEALANAHNDCLLCLDEIGELTDPKAIGETVYMLANGMGKGRANKAGGSRDRATFRTLYLSTGERNLADMMKQAGKQTRGGQEIRLIDLPADGGAGMGVWQALHGAASASEFAEQLKEAADAHYGHAIRAFLNFLTDHRSEWAAMAESLKVQRLAFVDKVAPDATGEVRRALAGFALAAAAGELAEEAGILPWPEGEAERAALACAAAWLGERGTAGSMDDRNAVTQVLLWLQQSQSSRFQAVRTNPDTRQSIRSSLDERPIIEEAGIKEWDDHGQRYLFFVHATVYREKVCAGYNWRTVTKALRDAGVLIPGRERDPRGNLKPMTRATFGNRGEQSYYCLTIPGADDVPELADEIATPAPVGAGMA